MARIIFKHPAETCMANNLAIGVGSPTTFQKPIAETLVVALKMVVGDVLFDCMTELSFAEKYHAA